MASNTVVLVTGLLTPLCTDFFAFSVRIYFLCHGIFQVFHQQSPEVEFRLEFFCFKSCVVLAACGPILQKNLGTYVLKSS